MGLFDKNICPICGEKAPKVFATRVEDIPICKGCAGKIFLPEGALDQMSLDEFQEYLNFYEENQVLRDKFQPNYEYNVDFQMHIRMDTRNGLFALSSDKNALVFEKSCIETYRILEDNEPLFQGNKKAIKFFESKIPSRVRDMTPMISSFEKQKREYEMMERMEDMMERREDWMGMKDDDNNRPYRYHPRPTFYGNEPFDHFSVRVRMEHPYWTGIHRGKVAAPMFDSQYPRIDSYMRTYNQRVEELRDLAVHFKELVNPKSKEIYESEKVDTPSPVVQVVAAASQAAPAVDVVEELKKFKGLLDAGIITEEEFTAKKKQLMGI